jgi:REP element-mobilizing transposase RayT
MNNHFHMLVSVRPVEIQEELFQKADLNSNQLRSPSRHLSNFFNAYTLSLNKQEDRIGSLFQRPFRRKEVNNESYFCQLVVYIHQNPVKHGFVSNISEYPYSSYRSFYQKETSFISTDTVIDLFGGIDNFRAAHEEMLQNFEPFQP